MLMEGFQKQDDDLLKWGLKHLNPASFHESPETRNLVKSRLNQTEGTSEFVELVERYGIYDEKNRLMDIVLDNEDNDLQKKAADLILKSGGINDFRQLVNTGNNADISAVLNAIGENRSHEVLGLLTAMGTNDLLDQHVRQEALKFMTAYNAGQDELLRLLDQNKLTGELKFTTAKNLTGARRESVRQEVAKYLDQDLPQTSNHPSISELITKTGDVSKGKNVFDKHCSLCHQVGGVGDNFGPDLSEIGQKLPKEGLYAAIFNPNAGISFGYEGYDIRLKDGSAVTGIITNRTDEELAVAFPGGNNYTYNMSEVASMMQTSESLMPPGLQNAMTTEELVDLTEYLISLK